MEEPLCDAIVFIEYRISAITFNRIDNNRPFGSLCESDYHSIVINADARP